MSVAIFQNPWVIGVGTIVVGSTIVYFFRLDKIWFSSDKPPSVENNSSQNNSQVQNVVINNIPMKEVPKSESISSKKALTPDQVVILKQELPILFIDDLDLKKKIKNLKDAGWEKVSQLYDALNIDIAEIRTALIIFVDYKGIGETDSDEQGLSIIKALRNRYGESKYIILYSAHPVPLDAFKVGANTYLTKNSTIYELEQTIIVGALTIAK